MVDLKKSNISKNSTPINMNNLRGRMIRLVSTEKTNKKEILIVYGQKSTLERFLPLAELVSKYGNVTIPDLPGFGGMSSFYKIGQLPTLQNYADYLAAFIKLKYRRRKITIVGLSFGFVVVTKMLQEYPELITKIDFLFSVSSFAHSDDLKLTKSSLMVDRIVTKFLSGKLLAGVYKNFALHPKMSWIISRFREQNYSYYLNQRKLSVRKRNDIRTHMFTTHELLKLDNCKSHINLPVYAINGLGDHHLYNDRVEQHYRIIFSDFREYRLKKNSSKSLDELDVNELEALLPARLKKMLIRYSKSR